MELFKNHGEICINIDQPVKIILKKESQLKILRNFHVTIFRDLLKTWQTFFVHDFGSFLIVPLKNRKINWNLTENFKKMKFPEVCEDLNALLPTKPADFSSTSEIDIEFPIEYFYKSILLPSILHRIHYLLLANNLRLQLIENAGIGNIKIHQNYKMNPSAIEIVSQKTQALSINDRKVRALKILQIIPDSSTLQQRDIIQVLTTSKSGDVFDMERFEVLGDAYLKFTISLFLFKNFPDWNEGKLTGVKGKIVSNRNLFYCGNDFGIPELLKYSNFLVNGAWIPPCIGIPKNAQELIGDEKEMVKLLTKLTLSQKEIESGNLGKENLQKLQQFIDKERLENRRFAGTAKEDDFDSTYLIFTNEQYFPDKIVADCVEALLGACCNSVGIKESLKLLKILKILPDSGDIESLLTEKINSRMTRQKMSNDEILKNLGNYRSLEQTIGYKFTDKSYLLIALTHASHPLNSTIGCYQELEFLGDAVLDFLITSFIFEQCPEMDPGQLTDLRSALVNNETLGSIVVRNQLQNFLKISNLPLISTIETFVNYQRTNKNLITDQILLVPENNETAECVEVPKVLGDIFESIIGAIYLDSDLNLGKVWKIVYSLMKTEIFTFMKDVPKQLSRELYEYPKADPKFHDTEKIGDKIRIPLSFKLNDQIVKVWGIGNNIKNAKKAASSLAIKKLVKQS